MSKFDQLIKEEQIRANKAAEIENAKLAEQKRKEQEFEELKSRYTSKIKEYLVDVKSLIPKIREWKTACCYTGFLKIKKNVRYFDLGSNVVTENGDFYQWVNKGVLTGPMTIDELAERIFVSLRNEYNDAVLLGSNTEEMVRQYFAKSLEGKV